MSAAQKTAGSDAGPSTSSTSQEPPRPPHRRSRLLTWAAFILLFLVVLVLIGALLIYGFVRPNGMVFKVTEAYVHEYNFTGCCHSESLNAVYNITMIGENDNKKVNISYSEVKIDILCNKQVLADETNVMDFFLEPRKVPQKVVAVKLHSRGVNLDECRVDYLPENQKGNMTIDVKLTAKIRFKPQNWRLDGRTIRVSCPHVNAYFAGGSNTFQPATCDVEI